MKFEKDISIIIPPDILEKMKICVDNAYPNEACGLVFGDITELNNNGDFQYHYTSKKFHCIESSQKSPVAFLIDNFEKLNEIFQNAAQEFNLRLVSIFHSHPSGSHPSGVDAYNMQFLDNCGNRGFKNQIWTIMDGNNKDLNGFIYFQNELMQVNVQIRE